MLFKENALRSERYKNNRIFFFKCIECDSELRVQQRYIRKHTGLCVRCAQFDKPYKACYSSLLKGAKLRNHEVGIIYEEFLEFTKINNCHYCNTNIVWIPHTTKDKEKSKDARSYKLDRMDNNLGYLKCNLAVCCKKCNEGKGNKYTYEEWYGMTEYFRNKS